MHMWIQKTSSGSSFYSFHFDPPPCILKKNQSQLVILLLNEYISTGFFWLCFV